MIAAALLTPHRTRISIFRVKNADLTITELAASVPKADGEHPGDDGASEKQRTHEADQGRSGGTSRIHEGA